MHCTALRVAGGFAGVCCNHPFDTIRNRFYNQPKVEAGGAPRFASATDCARQIMQHEGIGGLYRGFLAHYMRVGPHYVLTFVILEKMTNFLN